MNTTTPQWYVPGDSLSASIDLGKVMPGKRFPIREPSAQAYAVVSKLFSGNASPNLYEPVNAATLMIAYFDGSGAGAADWPGKDAKVEAWKTVAAGLPKTAIDRITVGCIVHFDKRFESDEGNA